MNLIKDVKCIETISYKFFKEMEKDTKKWNNIHVHGLETLKMDY